jgi:alpha-1,3-rhamnosyltransferase
MNEIKDLPLVTVCIPVYNHEKYVEEAIKSILNQTYKNIELIVIDDGSKDNSLKVIQKLLEKNDFIFIHRENKGLSATLNEGIKLSKGKYFCGCASDDIYIHYKLEKQVIFMEENPKYGMCYGKIIEFDNNNYKIKREIINAKSGWIFEELFMFDFVMPAVTTMIKKDIYKDVGLYDTSLFIEDYDMWLRIANKYQIGFINNYLAYYRKHETNISNQIFNMYESQKIIVYKWNNIVNFGKFEKSWQLRWFSLLSRSYKSRALRYLKFALMNPANLSSIKGFIKLLFYWKR